MTYKIPKEEFRSGRFIPPTVSSYPYNNDMPAKPYIVEIRGKVFAVDRTSNRIYIQPLSEYDEHGPTTQIDDKNINSWIAGSPPPAENKYIELPKETSALGIFEAFRERDLRLKHPSDTNPHLYVHPLYITEGYWNNKVGKGVSEIENSRQRLSNYFGTEIAQALAEKAVNSGKKLEDITYIGVGFLPENAIAAVARTKDGKVMFIESKGAYRKVSEQARVLSRIFGIYIDPETMWETVMGEEQEHINRKSYDNPKIKRNAGLIAEEEATKYSVYREFSDLEKNAQGGDPRNPNYRKLQEKYGKQAKVKKLDWKTTKERYKERPGPYQIFYLDSEEGNDGNDTGRQEASSLENRVSNEHSASARPSLKLIRGGKYRQDETYQKPEKSEYRSMDDVKAARNERRGKNLEAQEAPKESGEGKDAQDSEAGESAMPQAA